MTVLSKGEYRRAICVSCGGKDASSVENGSKKKIMFAGSYVCRDLMCWPNPYRNCQCLVAGTSIKSTLCFGLLLHPTLLSQCRTKMVAPGSDVFACEKCRMATTMIIVPNRRETLLMSFRDEKEGNAKLQRCRQYLCWQSTRRSATCPIQPWACPYQKVRPTPSCLGCCRARISFEPCADGVHVKNSSQDWLMIESVWWTSRTRTPNVHDLRVARLARHGHAGQSKKPLRT
jgi:hypothetical protein